MQHNFTIFASFILLMTTVIAFPLALGDPAGAKNVKRASELPSSTSEAVRARTEYFGGEDTIQRRSDFSPATGGFVHAPHIFEDKRDADNSNYWQPQLRARSTPEDGSLVLRREISPDGCSCSDGVCTCWNKRAEEDVVDSGPFTPLAYAPTSTPIAGVLA
ncbi:hypothetical protein EIP91_005989 [Steccherinum ochraceum]|uniref:Secreted protein n=1 Tax=Steccherinum ochraceum TaxID=92696 RepID=A0A4V2MVM6_9APHY|nr:hypothetical protein EIP91_005989 [Steccherinum ochraceum]